jgi:hypothetical protein
VLDILLERKEERVLHQILGVTRFTSQESEIAPETGLVRADQVHQFRLPIDECCGHTLKVLGNLPKGSEKPRIPISGPTTGPGRDEIGLPLL